MITSKDKACLIHLKDNVYEITINYEDFVCLRYS